jgi:hypothetical protein
MPPSRRRTGTAHSVVTRPRTGRGTIGRAAPAPRWRVRSPAARRRARKAAIPRGPRIRPDGARR